MPEGKDPLVPTKLKVAPPSTAQVLCFYFLVLSSLKVEREDVCAHMVMSHSQMLGKFEYGLPAKF